VARKKSRLDLSTAAADPPEMTRETKSPVGLICCVRSALTEYNSLASSSSRTYPECPSLPHKRDISSMEDIEGLPRADRSSAPAFLSTDRMSPPNLPATNVAVRTESTSWFKGRANKEMHQFEQLAEWNETGQQAAAQQFPVLVSIPSYLAQF
jgi:hypothetical protein